jgi:pimeloyl-ACP methyl ester carboxylesterase
VRYFMRKMVGVPAFFVALMRFMPGVWRKLEAVAHTLPYDAAVMRGFGPPPAERFASIGARTLALHGARTDARLARAAEAVARTVPNARHRALAGQNHNVKPEVLAPVVAEFFAA